MRADVDHTNTGTLSQEMERGAVGNAGEPFLFLVFHADRPYGASSRHALTRVDEVHLRRGATRASARVTDQGKRQLLLTISDRWMSGVHTKIERRGREWWIQDTGSKNGTFIDGKKITSTRLAADTVIEVGRTFLLSGKTYRRFEIPLKMYRPHRRTQALRF